MDINILINLLIDCKLYRYNSRLVFKMWRKDNNFLYKNYYRNVVPEDKLLKLIKNSQKNKKLQYLINDILFIIDEKSFTDDVINYCVYEYRNNSFRSTLLSILAHLKLSNYQLETINKFTDTSEAFFELLIRKLNDKTIDAADIDYFMLENKKFIEDAVNFQDYVSEEAKQDKIEVVKAYINNYFKKESIND